MTSDVQDLRRRLAARLVHADVSGLFDWHHYTRATERGVHGLLFAPVFSLFLIEFRKYAAGLVGGGLPPMPPGLERVAQTSRAALKQAEHPAAYVEELARVIDLHDHEFRGEGRGLRGRLRRALADDMAVWTVGGSLVLTTHHAAIALGGSDVGPLSSKEMGERGHQIGRLAGEYIGACAAALRLTPPDTAPDVLAFEPKDLRSQRYLGDIGRRLGSSSLALTAAVLGVVGAINVAALVLPKLPSRSTLFSFKLRFVTTFHALESLRKLKAFGRSHDLLSADGLRRLSGSRETVAGTREVLAHAKLRKLLVHHAEVEADRRDLTRDDLRRLATELAAGSVPAALEDLLDRIVQTRRADLAYLAVGP